MGGSADEGGAASRAPLCDGATWQMDSVLLRPLLKGCVLWTQSRRDRRRHLLCVKFQRNGAPLDAHPFQLSR